MKNSYTPKKIGIMAVFIAIGLVLQYVESRISILSIPGGKLGLANAVSIINIFMFGGKNALIIAILRATLTSLMVSGIATLPYGVLGAIFSILVMALSKKYFYPQVSIIGISVLGAAFHNIAQLLVAFLQYGSPYVFSYLPGLMVMGVLSGIVTGYTAMVFSKRALKIGGI